jgi:hypothetical protein
MRDAKLVSDSAHDGNSSTVSSRNLSAMICHHRDLFNEKPNRHDKTAYA